MLNYAAGGHILTVSCTLETRLRFSPHLHLCIFLSDANIGQKSLDNAAATFPLFSVSISFVLPKGMVGLRLCMTVLFANFSGKLLTFKHRQNYKNCFHDIITLSSLTSILKHAMWPFSSVLNKGWQLVSPTKFVLHFSSEAQYNLFLQKNLPLELTNWQGFINNWWDMQAALMWRWESSYN